MCIASLAIFVFGWLDSSETPDRSSQKQKRRGNRGALLVLSQVIPLGFEPRTLTLKV
jgi:hypothetical protein